MIISKIFIIALPICIKNIMAAQISLIPDSTSFLLWKMIPTDVRHEILRYHVQNNGSKMKNEITVISPETASTEEDLDGLTILERIDSAKDWISEANNILNRNIIKFSLKTQLNLLTEIIKHAPVPIVQTIFDKYPYAGNLLKYVKDEDLTKLVLDSRLTTKDIKNLLLVLERYSKFNLAQLSVLTLIRDRAISSDSCDLLKFTNEYPEIIEPSEMCPQALLMQCTNYLPNIWDKMICSYPFQINKICKRNDGLFVKFKLFSQPLLTRDWTLEMFALACEEFDKLLNLPDCLISSTGLGSTCPKHTTGHLSKIEQMIPMIYLKYDRERILNKYGLSCNCEVVQSFQAPDENGVLRKVEVLLPSQQKFEEPIRRIKNSIPQPDSESFVNKILSQLETQES